MSTPKTSPQYPAKEGGTITGNPVCGVEAQGSTDGLATCGPICSVATQGTAGRSDTCVPAGSAQPTSGVSSSEENTSEVSDPFEPVLSRQALRKKRRRVHSAALASDKAPEEEPVGGDPRETVSPALRGVVQTSLAPCALLEGSETLAHPQRVPTGAEIPAGSSAGTSEGASRKPGAGKRKPAEGTMPPKKSRKKGRSKLGETFEQAASDQLLGVVVVENDAFRFLTQSQISLVRSELLKELGLVITSRSVPIPRFNESGMVKGRFHLSCHDSLSFTWLQEVIARLTVRGDNEEVLRLMLVPPSELPKLRRAEVFITGPPAEPIEVTTWLTAQNPGLNTERWHLRFRNTMQSGQLLVWGIDPTSITALEALNFRPFYGLSRVTFRVSRGSGQEATDSSK
jgi:hypothetical protein